MQSKVGIYAKWKSGVTLAQNKMLEPEKNEKGIYTWSSGRVSDLAWGVWSLSKVNSVHMWKQSSRV